MSKIIGVIPARMASVRLPGKMVADLCGKPLIVRTAESVAKSNAFDEIIVATDSEEIVKAVEDAGFKAVLTSPALPSGTARVAEVAKQTDADIYVNIQGDEPLIDAQGLINLVKVFQNPEVEMATLWFPLASEDENNPNAVKLVTDANNDALYFSRSIIPYPRNNEKFAPKKHLGVYGYRKQTLLRLLSLAPCDLEKIESLEQLRVLYHGIKIRVVKASKDSVGVDTAEDLEKVRTIIRQKEP